MASAAPLQMRWGVTVCMPSGIALVIVADPCVWVFVAGPKRDDQSLDQHPALVFSFEHDLSGKPVSTHRVDARGQAFPDHAPEASPNRPASGQGLRPRLSGSAALWRR